MKTILYCASVLVIGLLVSCGSSSEKDPKEIADSTNTANIDSAKKADTAANTDNHLATMTPDAEFVTTAADGGMLEIQLGKLAQEKGQNSLVKSFGAMMVKDHSKADEQLKTLASAKNITLPASMSDKCRKMVDELSAKSGADFDKAYISAMVSGHKDNIDLFKKEAEKGNDSLIVAWAKGKLPTLEHHLMMAEQADKSVRKKGS